MVRLFKCSPSAEDDRPQIDFELKTNARNDWLVIGEVLDATRPAEDFPAKVSITVRHPDALLWDAYFDGNGGGLYSHRFSDAVCVKAFVGIETLPVLLNGVRYYFFRRSRPVDCLDQQASRYDVYPFPPHSISIIHHYAFREELVPKDGCFCIPEEPFLLVTESVVHRIESANLKGVCVDELK